jgi:hypothetical protein
LGLHPDSVLGGDGDHHIDEGPAWLNLLRRLSLRLPHKHPKADHQTDDRKRHCARQTAVSKTSGAPTVIGHHAVFHLTTVIGGK